MPPQTQPDSRQPHARFRGFRSNAQRWLLLAGLMLLCFAAQSYAQGCTQCLDSTRATPPGVQAAYRKAIAILGCTGATLFLGGLYLLRREP